MPHIFPFYAISHIFKLLKFYSTLYLTFSERSKTFNVWSLSYISVFFFTSLPLVHTDKLFCTLYLFLLYLSIDLHICISDLPSGTHFPYDILVKWRYQFIACVPVEVITLLTIHPLKTHRVTYNLWLCDILLKSN